MIVIVRRRSLIVCFEDGYAFEAERPMIAVLFLLLLFFFLILTLSQADEHSACFS